MSRLTRVAAILLIAATPAFAQEGEKKYPVGKYPADGKWFESHAKAWEASRKDGKLVMLKFLFVG